MHCDGLLWNDGGLCELLTDVMEKGGVCPRLRRQVYAAVGGFDLTQPQRSPYMWRHTSIKRTDDGPSCARAGTYTL